MQNQGLPTSTEGSLSTAQTTQVRSVPTANNDINLIRSPTDLRPGDILLGRGNKHQKWSGNMHFRSLIVERQEKYVSIKGDNRTKNAIARQIFDAVRAGSTSSLAATAAATAAAVVPALKDGRFLKLVEPEMLAQMGVGDAVDDQQQRERERYWQEVPNDVALEKIKMALRQQKKGGAGSKNGDDDDSSDDDDESSSSSSSSSDIDDEEGSNDSSDVEKRPKSKNKKAKVRSKTKKAKNKTKKKEPKRRRKKRDKSPKVGGSNTSTTDGMPLQVSIGGGGGGVSAPPLPGSGPA